jgi:hypothetical protein
MLGTIEVVLGLCKGEATYDVCLVRGIAPVGCAALCDANAPLAMLPMILVRVSTDGVRSVLELFVTEPYEGSIASALNHATWMLYDFVCARPSFAQPECLTNDATEKLQKPSRHLRAYVAQPVTQAIGDAITEDADVVLFDW